MAILQGARITGSVTVTQFIKAASFSGSLTASNLYVRGNVGIGTTSPIAKLDIRPTTDGNAGISIGTGGAVSGTICSPANLFINANTGNAQSGDGRIAFGFQRTGFTGGSEVMRIIENGGNVGIGTTSAPTKLTSYVGSGTISGTNDAIRLQVAAYNNAARNTIVWAQDNSNLVLGRYGLEWNSSNSQMNFVWRDMYNSGAGSTELMRLSAAGNLGIGTTSPASKLDVSGSISIRGTAVLQPAADIFPSGLSYDIYGNIRVLRSTSAQADGMYIGYGGSGGNLRFFSNSGTTEFMTIATSGNVGIGSTSPAYKFHIYSGSMYVQGGAGAGVAKNYKSFSRLIFDTDHSDSARGPNKITLYDAGGSWVGGIGVSSDVIGYYSGANHIWHKSTSQTAFTEYMRLDSNGNLGIGTSSPTINGGGLQVYGSGQKGIRISGNSSNSYSVEIGCDTTKMSYIQTVGGLDRGLQFYTGNATTIAMTLTGSSVGIGTTSPAARLQILKTGDNGSNGLTDYGIVTVSSGNATQATLGAEVIGDGYSNLNLGSNISGVRRFWHISKRLSSTDSAHSLQYFYYDGSTFNQRFTFTTDGNLGIGTSVPTVKLAVSDGTTVAQVNPYSGVAYFGTVNNYPMALSVNSSEKVRIDANGNVGIGTTSPAGKFEIKSAAQNYTTAPAITFTDNTGVSDSRWILGNIATTYGAFNLAEAANASSTSYTSRITILPGGNVGIGTTTPLYQLAMPNNSFLSFNNDSANPFGIGGGDNAMTRIVMGVASGAGSTIQFGKGTSGAYAGFTSLMTLNYVGNLGIGTTSPATKLDVRGNVFVANAATGNNIISFGNIGTLGPLNGAPNNLTGSAFLVVSSSVASGAPSHMKFYTTTGGTCGERMRIAADGNVGIGTTTLSSLLTLNGTYPQIIANNPSTGSGVVIQLRDNGRDAGFMGHSTTTARLQFGSRGSTAAHMTISGDGDVGIGTTAPTNQTNYRFLQVNSSVSSVIETMVAGSRIGGFDSTASTLYVGTIGSYPVVFRTAVVEKMRIATDGNVGIGTSSPNYPIDLQSTTSPLTLNLKLNKGSVTNDYAELAFQLWSGAGSGANTFGGAGTSRPSVVLRALNENGSSAAGAFIVGTFTGGADNTTLNERFRISSVGNVGIGTSTTGEKITISGNALVFGGAGAVGTGTAYYLGDGANSRDIALTRVGTAALAIGRYYPSAWAETIRFTADGNVGIGSSSPGAKLVVTGEVQIQSSAAYYTHLNYNDSGINYITSANTGATYFRGSSNGITAMYVSGDGTVVAQYSTYLATVSGNVGIGTNAPTAKLTVIASNNTGSRIQLGTASTSTFMDANKVNDLLIATVPYNSNPASVSNSGAKWGIKMNGSIDNVNLKGKSACVYAVSEDSLGYNRQVGLALHTSGLDLDSAERVRISNTGNVGIGTTSVSANLVVGYNASPHYEEAGATNVIIKGKTGNSRGLLEVHDSAGTVKSFFQSVFSTGLAYIGTISTHSLVITTTGTERVRIDTNGNVGIGSSSPSYKLHVNGTSGFEDTLNITVDQRIQTYPASTGGYGMGLTLWSANTSGVSEAYGRPGFIGRNLSWNGSNFIAATTNSGNNWGVVAGTMFTNNDVRFLTRAASENGLNYSLGTNIDSITRMLINTSGNVGIGTTSPVNKLHVSGSSTNLPLKLEGLTSNATGYFLTVDNTTGVVYKSTSGASGTSGTSGANGSPGTSGSSGVSGAAGTSGSSGANGGTGSSGSSGTTSIKAWVHFDGTATSGTSGIAPNASNNVSSITDNGTGDYTINFTSAFANAFYVVSGTVTYDYENPGQSINNTFIAVPRRPTAQAAGSCRIVTFALDNVLYDCKYVRVAFSN